MVIICTTTTTAFLSSFDYSLWIEAHTWILPGFRFVSRTCHEALRTIPSGLRQVPASGSLQGYPFGSDWYALVGALKRRYCPSWLISLKVKKARALLSLSSLRELRGLKSFFLARNICPTIFIHLILVKGNLDLTFYLFSSYYWKCK